MDLKALMAGLPPWVILAAGFLFGWVKQFWNFVYSHTILVVEKRIKVEVTIEDHSHGEAFKWMNVWVEHLLEKKRVNSLRLERKASEDEEDDDNYRIVPGYGSYFLWWNKRPVTFVSAKSEKGGDEYGGGEIFRTITLTIWLTRNRAVLLDAVVEAKEFFEKQNPKKAKYYTHRSSYWQDNHLTERNLDTIYLPPKKVEDILNTIDKFLSSKDKYRTLGIPWRTGLLFEGPTGTGKTSLVHALSCHFKIPIYYMNLSSLASDGMSELLKNIHGDAIVLMEDIDGVDSSAKRKKKDDKETNQNAGFGIKLNEVLNLLDGLVATERRIVIMTTNHPENLDPALIRAGRVDRSFHIGYAEEPELRKFHDKAKELYDLPEFSVFRKSLPENCTIADAQAAIFKPHLTEVLNSVITDTEGEYAAK